MRMTEYQIGTWVLGSVMGTGMCLISGQPSSFLVLAGALVVYPIFCTIINTITDKIKERFK